MTRYNSILSYSRRVGGAKERPRFKRPWDGTDGLLMTPFQLIARLAAIVPQPRKNLIDYHSIFAPAAAGRAAIVPVRPPPAARPTLLHRVFGANAFACPHCETRRVVHAVVQGGWATSRVLASLARPSRQPRLVRARGPPPAP